MSNQKIIKVVGAVGSKGLQGDTGPRGFTGEALKIFDLENEWTKDNTFTTINSNVSNIYTLTVNDTGYFKGDVIIYGTLNMPDSEIVSYSLKTTLLSVINDSQMGGNFQIFFRFFSDFFLIFF